MTDPAPLIVASIIERTRRQAASPINRLIDGAMRCTRCDLTMDHCLCYVRLACPICGRTMLADHDETNPPLTGIVLYPCPKHQLAEDNPPPRYFCATTGHELFWTLEDADERRREMEEHNDR